MKEFWLDATFNTTSDHKGFGNTQTQAALV